MAKVKRWKFKDLVAEIRDQAHYRSVEATHSDGFRVVYSIGDCIYLEGEDGSEWIAMIVDLFSDPTERNSKRVLLRWFYSEYHLITNLKVDSGVKMPWLPGELFFSDHIDYDLNSVECIAGKVFIHATQNQVAVARRCPTKRNGYHKDDRHYFVRSFYRLEPSARIRPLATGELDFLLNNPSEEEMWDSFSRPISPRRRMLPLSLFRDELISTNARNTTTPNGAGSSSDARAVRNNGAINFTKRKNSTPKKRVTAKKKKTSVSPIARTQPSQGFLSLNAYLTKNGYLDL